MAEIIKVFSGHSGCTVLLMRNADTHFVRKISPSESYNSRLKKQCKKQKRFNYSKIHTPKILNTGIANDRFYFDMEYVRGTTMARMLPTLSRTQVHQLVDLLFNAINISERGVQPHTDKIFSTKILRLSETPFAADPVFNRGLAILRDTDFTTLPHSFCCGDLTLENIMVAGGEQHPVLYLIDFLDSFFNSWLIDIAKLMQDLELGWSYRYETQNPNLAIRLDYAKSLLLERIKDLPDGQDITRYIYTLLLLNTMRILPYATDTITQNFCYKSIKQLISKLQGRIE